MNRWQSGFIEVDGLRLHYTRTGGDKPPLVLAHGFSDDGLCWTRVAEALEETYDVVMVDACGHGLSDERTAPYGPIEQAKDLAGVIKGLGLDRPCILGHSMGAVTTLVLAGLEPDLPRAILLEDPPASWATAPEVLPSGEERRKYMRDWFTMVKRQTRDEMIARERRISPRWDEAEFEPWANSKFRASPNILHVLGPQASTSVDWFSTLRRITCPALLITADGIIKPHSAASLQGMVRQLRTVYIPQAGHSIRREKFDRYMEVVQAFLVDPPTEPVISPEVLADGRVTFRLVAPYATEVALGGDWMSFGELSQPMTLGNDGVWSATIGPLPPDLYAYWLTLNGVRIADPRNPDIFASPSSPSSLVLVPGPESEFLTVKSVPHGAISSVWYHSSLLDKERRLQVYTPPGYGDDDHAYPVLYLMHGGGSSDMDWSVQARAGFILDNLLADGAVEPMIIVMPDGNVGTTRPTDDPFAHELLDNIIPLVEGRYRTRTDRRGRALAGFSMGGVQTLNVGLFHLDMVSQLGVFSSGWFPPMLAEIKEHHQATLEAARGQLDLLWIARGNEDRLVERNNEQMLRLLDQFGIQYTYQERPGGHNWGPVRRFFAAFAPLLFRGD